MRIKEFQKKMRQIYFERDSNRGVNGTFDWLIEEVEELKEAMKGESTEAKEEEFADVFAWLASLANVIGIDLEKAVIVKYQNGCPKCGQIPCKCSFKEKGSKTKESSQRCTRRRTI